MTVELATVTSEVLVPQAIEALVHRPDAGGVCTFTGFVRDHDHDRSVSCLDYSAHPSAASVLHEVAVEIAARPQVLAVAVSHRVGSLVVGDAAIVASVSSAHRATAFSACALLVDEIKARLPIWKNQTFTDGTDEWVGAC